MVFAVTLPFLTELVALFTISVIIAYFCYRLNIVPIVGFLIAGVIIGPNALALVHDQQLVDTLAEIGIILLLFTIGIEFSLEKLSRIKKAIFLGGGLQVTITVAVVAFILSFWGIGWNSAIYTGCLIALSSTAIILGLLSDEDKTDTPSGRLTLAILIFQDLIIILMVLLVPILAGQSQNISEIGWVLLKAIVLIGVVLLLAQRIVPWILEKVASTRRHELFLLTIVAICFGTASLTSMVGVSLALGAFLAGLVVSESNYSEQAISEILPLRTIFNAVFFVSVGMLLDINYVIRNPLIIIGVATAVILIKFITSLISIVPLKYPARIISISAITLAQIGEFSFVLERAGRLAGITPAGIGEAGTQTFIAVAVLLMVATPFMVHRAEAIGGFLAATPFGRISGSNSTDDSKSGVAPLEDHVVIIGFGPAGRHLAEVLHDSGIPYIVIEINPESVKEMHRNKIPAIFGDAGRQHILERAGIEKAKLCVIATNDPGSTPRIIRMARHLNPLLLIVVRTRYLGDMERFEKLGADIVVPEEMETTVRLFSHVLGAYRIPQKEIRQHIDELRAQNFDLIRSNTGDTQLMFLEGLEEKGLHTRSVKVRESSLAENKSLNELALKKNHNVTVINVKRGDEVFEEPSDNFVLKAGDWLLITGSADNLMECASHFRSAKRL